MLRRLYQHAAQATGGPHHQNPFTRFYLSAVPQLREGQRAVSSDHRSRDEIELIRHDLHRGRRDLHEIRVSPPSVDAEQFGCAVRLTADDGMTDDTVTDLERFHVRGYGGDL